MKAEEKKLLERLRATLDAQAGRYKELARASSFGQYLDNGPSRDDEEILTEPILADLVERVLKFPKDAYFPQYGRSGLKPDLTPMDTIAHPFVFDAKSSLQKLPPHEKQIRAYMDQRQLDSGILFNLHEIRTYRRGQAGHDPDLSFALRPVWEAASGQAMPMAPDVAAFFRFASAFAHREMGQTEKVDRIRAAKPWMQREAAGESIEVDIDFLVEKLRDLSLMLSDDAAGQGDELSMHLKLSQGRERLLLRELEVLALDLAPGIDPKTLPESVEDYLASDGLPRRVWSQYLRRVAQMALARIMLYRSWGDVGFVDGSLYDGGFDHAYEQLDGKLREVLKEAFAHGLQRYPWLYGADNNYDWYRPRDDALAEVLYSLIPFPLGKLDADVLGGLYESYVDEIDRDRLGQFFTPRSVVRFMLDRAGFAGTDGVFRLEGNERKPREIYDFATGSGGFLVEAARRVIDEGGIAEGDVQGLKESLTALVTGFHGSEISPFPYYLTEINLLLQVSRLLGSLSLAGVDPPGFVLGVVHADSLTARSGAESIEGMEPEERKDLAKLSQDEGFGLVPLDAQKQAAFDRVRENNAFDLVVGNPPYVFETNNRILFERLRGIPAWADVYRGKSDYLYYFLWLAAEKVKPGGKLCVITPAGWMNAGNADWLRERLASILRLDELFLFGSHRLFAPEREARTRRHRAPTPTVESAILVATKAKAPSKHKLRVVALEDEARAAKALSNDEAAKVPDRDALLDEMAKRARANTGRKGGIHVHRIAQADLVHDRPWPIKHGAEDVATRAVDYLQALLDNPDSPVETLDERWSIFRGIETGADAYSARIQRRLRDSFPHTLHQLELDDAQVGDPIMELPPGTESSAPWNDHPDVLARSIEPRAILYAALDESDYTSLVWLGRKDQTPSAIIKALERWRPVLEKRAEIARNPSRRWWECAWPRDKSALRRPKVISLYRTDRGRFALDEDGAWQPSTKTTLVIPDEEGPSVAYLCGLLNSELLDLWYSIRGKNPRDVWRNYEPKPMARIPYRHVDDPDEEKFERVEQLGKLLDAENSAQAASLSAAIGADLRGGVGDPQEAAAALAAIVRAIAANRKKLLPYRESAPDLTAVVKDPWRTGPFNVDPAAVVAGLPNSATVSVRIDSALEHTIESDGNLGKPKLEGGTLELRFQRQVTATVSGPASRLHLLDALLARRKKVLPADLEETLLPSDIAAFEATVESGRDQIQRLLEIGRELVEAAERLVCRLYDVPAELEDEVVEHAIQRSGSLSPVGESDSTPDS